MDEKLTGLEVISVEEAAKILEKLKDVYNSLDVNEKRFFVSLLEEDIKVDFMLMCEAWEKEKKDKKSSVNISIYYK